MLIVKLVVQISQNLTSYLHAQTCSGRKLFVHRLSTYKEGMFILCTLYIKENVQVNEHFILFYSFWSILSLQVNFLVEYCGCGQVLYNVASWSAFLLSFLCRLSYSYAALVALISHPEVAVSDTRLFTCLQEELCISFLHSREGLKTFSSFYHHNFLLSFNEAKTIKSATHMKNAMPKESLITASIV